MQVSHMGVKFSHAVLLNINKKSYRYWESKLCCVKKWRCGEIKTADLAFFTET